MRLGFGEVLKKGIELQGEARRDFMVKNFTTGLGAVIQYALDPRFEFDLPPGTPPFERSTLVDQESNAYTQYRKIYMFIKPGPNILKHGGHVPAARKELSFIQMLEGVSGLDADVFVAMKDKSLPFGWTAQLINEVYPGLLPATALTVPVVEEQPATGEQKAPVRKAPAKKPTAKKAAAKKPAAKKPPARKPANANI